MSFTTKIQFCFFAGPIPESIGNCIKLTSVFLYSNQLTGKSTYYNFASRKLNFHNFAGPVPESIGDCIKLKSLDLSSNQLTGKSKTAIFLPTMIKFLLFRRSYSRINKKSHRADINCLLIPE